MSVNLHEDGCGDASVEIGKLATAARSQTAPPVRLIDYRWYHAVNDVAKLDETLNAVASCGKSVVHAIETDIIFSEQRCVAVMGHPPLLDGDLTLAEFLRRVQDADFQGCSAERRGVDDDGGSGCDGHRDMMTAPPKMTRNVLKLDFKSAAALKDGLPHVRNYVGKLKPPSLRRDVWINADILEGPGFNEGDLDEARRPKFGAEEFLELVTRDLPGTVLSIGWTTCPANVRAPYTEDMVKRMEDLLRPYPEVEATFPIRATSFQSSGTALRGLYDSKGRWTVTLWWSRSGDLSDEDLSFMYDSLEDGGKDVDGRYCNRTYYDIIGMSKFIEKSRSPNHAVTTQML